uniref:Uncharacterized protein n=1 Tax=Skeletonema marinoi TaxID=267567 RepID=A0A7S2PYJ7_9STRA|mmetsp:Transcript_4459/g.7681  ORF Transcript_4459/g.7681 Transcript_4459/m.7681 type:complete len:465 (+) Transcript_4459:130-1524(+)
MTMLRTVIPFCLVIVLFNLRLDLSRFIPEGETAPQSAVSPKNHSALSNDEYLKWLQEARRRSLNLSSTEEPIRIMYRAMNGLGHQLTRLSAAYHFAMLYQIPRVWPTHNPYCRGNSTIFTIYDYLIGEGQLMVDIPFFGDNNLYRNPNLFPRPNITLDHQDQQRVIHFSNEVQGYGHARAGKLWSIEYLKKGNALGKEVTDYQLYHQLMLLFEHKHKARIQKVLEATRFNEHTVFGLHIRTGNGETGDFTFKGRGMNDLDGWVARVVLLLCDYEQKHSHYFTKKPLMVYVGTDTGSVMQKLRAASNKTCEIPFVSSDQTFVEEGKSVTWNLGYDDLDKCLTGWEDMFLDMYLFTRCNSVMAGTYSSFTQSAPLSFMMHKAKRQQLQQQGEGDEQHPHYFCDVGVDGNRMDCASTLIGWLNQTTSMTWGVLNATKQRMKHEIMFPVLEGGGAIAQAFGRAGIKMD